MCVGARSKVRSNQIFKGMQLKPLSRAFRGVFALSQSVAEIHFLITRLWKQFLLSPRCGVQPVRAWGVFGGLELGAQGVQDGCEQ